jgi:hypothetical protein
VDREAPGTAEQGSSRHPSSPLEPPFSPITVVRVSYIFLFFMIVPDSDQLVRCMVPDSAPERFFSPDPDTDYAPDPDPSILMQISTIFILFKDSLCLKMMSM